MPEHELAADQAADDLEGPADALLADGEDVNSYSDVDTLTTRPFAAVLFIAAISERFDYFKVRASVLALTAIGLAAGVAVALGQPVTTG